MKTGDYLLIYQDPVTKKKPEGTAQLLKKIREDDDFETWLVHFPEDDPGQKVERKILKNTELPRDYEFNDHS
jgi:mRNA deadenylase 3'-5' endonuclease subunit Ccr4